MTKYDLFESIGNADDELIERAIEPNKGGKRVFLAITSLAACAVFACAAVLLLQNMNKSNNAFADPASSAVGTNSEAPVLEDSTEKTLEEMPFEIYYVVNGKMKQKTIVTDASPENLFNIWKKENQIGDEVRFISVKLSDNGTTEISEYSGVGVATHKVGDHTVYTMTITKNIEQYYDSIEKELLLNSLEKTMTGMCDPKPDEYKLILSDTAEEGKDESKSSIPDNEQGNDDTVNSNADPDTEVSSSDNETEESGEYVTQEYIPDRSETDQSGSNYADESESNRVDPDDIRYNDQGEILE